ncbi:MAG: hypothetical protein ACAI43_08700 [Phycisphaerae bacterium]|nr:hypothetical protein [Tepidisphaeraceae bacterium]
MPKVTKTDVERVLTRDLGLADPLFVLESNGGRINGSIVSPTFKGKSDRDRQRMIWDALDRAYGAASVRTVGMLLAYTPDEWDVDDVASAPKSKRKKAG